MKSARVAVHFTAIYERFAPNDASTTFEIAEAKDLTDSKLSAACSLHAASGSNTSSTSSLRRRRLGEIAEEDEEEQQRETKRRSLSENNESQALGSPTPTAPESPVKLNSELAVSPEHAKFSNASTSEVPDFVGVKERPTSSASAASGRRISSQSTRTELFSNYASSYYSKPRVKLGPRPSLDTHNRAQTAGNFRPVSSIPAGLKLFGKGSKGSGQSRKGDPNDPSTDDTVSVIEFSALGILDGTARPATSSGVSIASTITPGKPAMTREKARLKKAMELREKKKKMAALPPPLPTEPIPVPMDAQTIGTTETSIQGQGTEITSAQEPEYFSITGLVEDAKRVTMIKADSGVAMDLNLGSLLHTDQVSEDTQIDSRPTSLIMASSEADQSTKASSVSGSTNETVQAQDGHARKAEVELEQDPATQKPLGADITAPFEESALEQAPAVQDNLDADIAAPLEESAPEVVRSSSEQLQPMSASPAADEEKLAGPATLEEPYELAKEEIISPTSASPAAGEERLAGLATLKEPHDLEQEEMISPRTLLRMSQDPERMLLKPLTYVPGKTKAEHVVISPKVVTQEQPHKEDMPTSSSAAENCETLHVETAEIYTSVDNSAADATSAPLMIPTSKFSMPDLRAAAKASSAIPSEPLPQPSNLETFPTNPSEENPSPGAVNHGRDSEGEAKSPKQKRFPEPIRINNDATADNSRAPSLISDDDDGLLDELQSATLEEARPMFVTKTPVTSLFPSSARELPPAQPQIVGSKPHMVRTVSNPVGGGLIAPPDVSQSSARSMSMGAAYLHKVTQQAAANNLSKKSGKLSTGITQRIKALEKLSATTEPPSQSGSRPSSTFFTVSKSRDASRSPSVVDRNNSFSFAHATPVSAEHSRNPSPDAIVQRERTGSMASRLSVFESPPRAAQSRPFTPQTQRGRPESVSVTARIIRDGHQPLDRHPDAPMELMQSPLSVDRHMVTSADPPATERRLSRESRRSASQDRRKGSKSRRSSISVVKDFIKDRRGTLTGPLNEAVPSTTAQSQSTYQQNNNSSSNRVSFSSRRSSVSKDRDNATEGSASSEDNRSTSGDRRASRTERFMRRLSQGRRIRLLRHPEDRLPLLKRKSPLPLRLAPPPLLAYLPSCPLWAM